MTNVLTTTKLKNDLTNYKKTLSNNPTNNQIQSIGLDMLDLADYNLEMAEDLDGTLTDYDVYSERIFDKNYNGNPTVLEVDEDTGNDVKVTANTLINVIDDVLYDFE